MAKNKSKSFTVLQPIWSIQHQQYFYPGEVVTFDLSGENVPDLTFLVSEQVLEPFMEVSNGENSLDSNTDRK
jgi:hypothetical protein